MVSINLTEIIAGVVATAGVVYGYWSASKTAKEKKALEETRSDWEISKELRDELRGELQALRTHNETLREANKTLRLELEELRDKWKDFELRMTVKISALESAHFDLPLPQWFKDDTGRIIFKNRYYDSVFLIPRGIDPEKYTWDKDAWPDDVAAAFKRVDDLVYSSKKPWVGYETVVNKDNKRYKLLVMKYPVLVKGICIGVAGIAIPSTRDELSSYMLDREYMPKAG